MEINRHNYEVYAIDFIEGKMDPSEVAVFIAFLADNPDIAQEVEFMRDSGTEVVASDVKQDFSYLMKGYNQVRINEDNFEELCIAYHEGDLSEKMQKKLIAFISFNKSKQKIFDACGQLKITPDESVVFKAKGKLKQKAVIFNVRRVVLITTTMAAAASLAMLFVFRNNTGKVDTQKVAQTSVKTIPNEVDNMAGAPVAYVEGAGQTESMEKQPLKIGQKEKKAENEATVAVVDDSVDSDVIRLTRIEPKPIPIQVSNNSNMLAFSLPRASVDAAPVEEGQSTVEEIRNKTNGLVAKASHLSVDNLIKTGINGFNSIAETDLSYKSQTDNKGRITEFALSSESFNIKRRIRNN